MHDQITNDGFFSNCTLWYKSIYSIATWCLVTLHLHRCGFKTAEQDTKSTRPSTVGLLKVIPSPGYPHPCPMSCITPPLAVLNGRAWWPFTGTSTVSCLLLCSKWTHTPHGFLDFFHKADYSAFHYFKIHFVWFLCLLQVIPFLCWPLRVSPTRPCRCPSFPSAASTPPLRPLWPPNLRNLTLDLPPLTSADPTQRSHRSQCGEKTHLHILQEPFPVGNGKRNGRKRENWDTSVLMFFFSWGWEYPTCSHFVKNEHEAFIISRNSLTVLYTTLRTHFASHVQHPPF